MRKARLTIFERLENIALIIGCPFCNVLGWTALGQWLFNTWRAEYHTWRGKGGRGIFIPSRPRLVWGFNWLTGVSCGGIMQYPRTYGVPSSLVWMQNELWPNQQGVGVSFALLVPGPQHWITDVILRWYEGDYMIDSPPVSDPARGNSATYARSVRPWRPWGVPAKPRSWDGVLFWYGFATAIDRTRPAGRPKTGRDAPPVVRKRHSPSTPRSARSTQRNEQSRGVAWKKIRDFLDH